MSRDGFPDELEMDDEGEMIDQFDKWLDSDPDPGSGDEDNSETENDLEWDFEEGETRVKDATYVFCPAPHRKQILHLFTKHFCQHPSFPERNEGSCSTAKIRERAVMEMYQFCWQRGLREVWGYLWNSWYSLRRWKLWARSTSPYISRWRTTMATENFWKQLKHNHLHHMLRPRLDLLVWILIVKVTPEYISRAEVLEDTHRLGRSKPLSSYFKSAWKKLAEVEVSENNYVTDVTTWTCNCGQQKFHSQHLCKHLVQAVPTPPMHFWRQVVRRRTSPLYRHPELASLHADGMARDYADPDEGSITDGDDHVWLGNAEALVEGQWQAFDLEGMLRKRPRSVMSSTGGWSSSADHDMEEVLGLVDTTKDENDSDVEAFEEVCQIVNYVVKIGTHFLLSSKPRSTHFICGRTSSSRLQKLSDLSSHMKTASGSTVWCRRISELMSVGWCRMYNMLKRQEHGGHGLGLVLDIKYA